MALSTYTTDPNYRFGGKGCDRYCKYNLNSSLITVCASFTVQKLHFSSPAHDLLQKCRANITGIRPWAALSLPGGGPRLPILEKRRYRRDYNNDSKASNHHERQIITPPRGR
jgi:hypothetical protein